MDVADSFLELSCVRVALIPAGITISDHRYEELASHLTAFREIPVSALPRRAAVPRATANATFSSMPAAFREAMTEATSTGPSLHRSRSASRNIGHPTQRIATPALRNSVSKPVISKGVTVENEQRGSLLRHLQSGLGAQALMTQKRHKLKPAASRGSVDLDMMGPDVDSSFRLRYDTVHRDHAGMLLMKPFSEWDDFHSSKIWGVIGIVDCTQPGVCDSVENRKHAISEAYDDFSTALTNFKDASVRRLIIFTSPDAAHESGAFILNDPKFLSKDANVPALHFSVGYVPERTKAEETRREVRAQIIHFSGLLLNAIDRDCWKRRESSQSNLLLSPIDEKYTADRQSKLAKRRAGRLDKVLGDSFLLMGNPAEALAKYNSAIEKAKTNSDRLWLAGAMEGWSAAHVLTYVGSGGSVSDRALSDRLIEHYAEIYKLYQKKRVAEPEAASALRLAGFLGRWTSRRKDALGAAEHAASVGESLRIQKRAALWEALARFSDQMGCRRKAALYLYRLGHLNASQSIWSSAVALMIASERQLSQGGRKPWSDLNRSVLLTAAGHAESAGDSSTAARLYAEALVIPSHNFLTRLEEDKSLIKSLNRSHMPTYLPAAQDVLELGDISALQVAGLSIRHRLSIDGGQENESEARDGPFIYNPFEAKERAKAAAVARRAVTWVRGEPAQVSARLFNRTSAELVVDVIAVLVKRPNDLDKEEGDSALRANLGDESESDTFTADDDDAVTVHTQNIRSTLTRSSGIAKSIPESITLPPQELDSDIVKLLTVIPKQTGPLHVKGLLVRLFSGALVIMEDDAFYENESPPVNVISALPRISIQTHSTEGGTIENTAGRTPLTVYDGERRRFHVDIENIGTEDVVSMRARVFSSRPEVLRISGHDLHDSTLLQGLEHHGGSKTFTVEVSGTHPSFSDDVGNSCPSEMAKSHSSLSSVSIIVEYEGKDSRGIIRESGTHVKVSSKSALRIRRLDFFTGPCELVCSPQPNEQSGYYVAIEVRNDVSAPATVKLVSNIKESQSDSSNQFSSLVEGVFLGEDHLIENGASARLICNMPLSKMAKLGKRVAGEGTKPQQDAGNLVFQILWKLPAFGRKGILEISHNALRKALANTLSSDSQWLQNNERLSYPKLPMNGVGISWSIDLSSINNIRPEERNSGSITVVRAGSFWTAEVTLRNTRNCTFAERTMLDVEVTQMDEHGVGRKSGIVMTGLTRGIMVGPLPPGTGEFSHRVRVRISSTGTFQLQACLYDATSMSNYCEEISSNFLKREGLTELPHEKGRQRNAIFPSTSPASKALIDDNFTTTTSPNTSANMSMQSSLTNPLHSSLESTQVASAPRKLQRVGVPRKRKADEAKTEFLPNVVHPSTVDSYPEANEAKPNRPHVLAYSTFPFSVLKITNNDKR